MKRFDELTQQEINAMSDDDFKAVSPFEKKSCADCCYLVSAINLWCGNEEAMKARGTNFPGVIKCTYWKPDWKRISAQNKTE